MFVRTQAPPRQGPSICLAAPTDLIRQHLIPRAPHHSHELVNVHRGVDGDLAAKVLLKPDVLHGLGGRVPDKLR